MPYTRPGTGSWPTLFYGVESGMAGEQGTNYWIERSGQEPQNTHRRYIILRRLEATSERPPSPGPSMQDDPISLFSQHQFIRQLKPAKPGPCRACLVTLPTGECINHLPIIHQYLFPPSPSPSGQLLCSCRQFTLAPATVQYLCIYLAP